MFSAAHRRCVSESLELGSWARRKAPILVFINERVDRCVVGSHHDGRVKKIIHPDILTHRLRSQAYGPRQSLGGARVPYAIQDKGGRLRERGVVPRLDYVEPIVPEVLRHLRGESGDAAPVSYIYLDNVSEISYRAAERGGVGTGPADNQRKKQCYSHD